MVENEKQIGTYIHGDIDGRVLTDSGESRLSFSMIDRYEIVLEIQCDVATSMI